MSRAVNDQSWENQIRAKRRVKYRRAFLFVAMAMGLWLSISALGVWAWVMVFHHLPPSRLFLSWYVGLGSAIVIPLSAIAPLAPMKGEDPEVLAADEFFKGPPR